MNNIIKLTIFTIILISMVSGCSPAGSVEQSNSNLTSSNSGNSGQTGASNTEAAMIPYPGTENTNGNAMANTNVQVVNVDTKQLKPSNPSVPAADNSEIVIGLNEKGGIETRTFKNNPVLSKIERTTAGNNIQVKVFLKNGKVINLPADKIRNFAADSAADILLAAGIAPPKPAQNPQSANAAIQTKGDAASEDSKIDRTAPTTNAPPVRMPTRP